nr:helix-turn-helix domain-containing protein [Pseudomonas sp.]
MDSKNCHPLEEAARIFGSEAALARELNVSRGALNQWKRPGRQVPAEHCPRIEQLTGVRCELLCPSVDWSVLRGSRRRVARAARSVATHA